MAYHGKTTLGLNSILLARSKVKKGLITSLSQAVDDFRHHSHKDLGRISEEKRFCGTVHTTYQGDIWELYQNGALSERRCFSVVHVNWLSLKMPQKHWKKPNPRTKK
ncbi:uncharacterized protein [Pocillopora verrucosa]|uniref:uncharacterized protein n=1 Tax=Pocillopora verrucosa TaxID=203993 RepID=UPI00333EE5AE